MAKKDFYRKPKGFTLCREVDIINFRKYKKARFLKAKKRFLTRVWKKDWQSVKYADYMSIFSVRVEEP